jgi:alcohol dehydrogenase (NADP+)
MGPFGSDRFTPDQVAGAVDGALRFGYRLFDYASNYSNEHLIGEVFAKALKDEVVKREELFMGKRIGLARIMGRKR